MLYPHRRKQPVQLINESAYRPAIGPIDPGNHLLGCNLTVICLRLQRSGAKTVINKKHLENVGPIRHCEPFYIVIHQVSLLSHAACASMSTITTTTTTTRDRGDRYGSTQWAQLAYRVRVQCCRQYRAEAACR